MRGKRYKLQQLEHIDKDAPISGTAPPMSFCRAALCCLGGSAPMQQTGAGVSFSMSHFSDSKPAMYSTDEKSLRISIEKTARKGSRVLFESVGRVGDTTRR